MFRFSHDRRFGKVSYMEFMTVTRDLSQFLGILVTEVLTCEDMPTYQCANITIVHPDVTAALQKRKSYRLQELTEEVWNRSLLIDVIFKSSGSMFTLSCDRLHGSHRILFYGQGVSDEFEERMRRELAPKTWKYKTGNGYSKPVPGTLEMTEGLMGFSFRKQK